MKKGDYIHHDGHIGHIIPPITSGRFSSEKPNFQEVRRESEGRFGKLAPKHLTIEAIKAIRHEDIVHYVNVPTWPEFTERIVTEAEFEELRANGFPGVKSFTNSFDPFHGKTIKVVFYELPRIFGKIPNKIEEEEESMNDITVIQKKTVAVKFWNEQVDGGYENGKLYNYAIHPAIEGEVKEGDVFVAQVRESGLAIVEVVIVHAQPNQAAKKFIIQRVDTAMNQNIIDKRARAAEIKVELQQRATIIQQRKTLEDIVKDDPEAQKLIDELKDAEGW